MKVNILVQWKPVTHAEGVPPDDEPTYSIARYVVEYVSFPSMHTIETYIVSGDVTQAVIEGVPAGIINVRVTAVNLANVRGTASEWVEADGTQGGLRAADLQKPAAPSVGLVQPLYYGDEVPPTVEE